MCQSRFHRAPNPPLGKADHLSLAIGDMVLAEGTSFWSRVEFQADNAQLVRSTGANVSVTVSQGPKSTPRKSRPLESGHRRYGVGRRDIILVKGRIPG